ncbi:HGGxSTG domain-containing protein [Streptomyces sp. NPDC051211]|uniref:HGGxSTG domain-containing protein n=1 Tax=Streptomyces sp. NPDC051211 TaxID=3154643 RepID=UPI00344C9D2A
MTDAASGPLTSRNVRGARRLRCRVPARASSRVGCAFLTPGPRETISESGDNEVGSRWQVTQPRCGAQTAKGQPCSKPAIMNSSRCQLHQGSWSSYGVAQRKKKDAEEKMRKLRKKK